MRRVEVTRRFAFLGLFGLGGCAVVTAIAKQENLIDATGHVRVFQSLLFAGQGVLAVAGAFFPGLGALQTAVTEGIAIVQAIQSANGATAAQIASLTAHTQTINDIAMPHATMTVSAVSVKEAS